jgi:hypothetical protein
MDWEWTFCVKYDDLADLSSTDDERHIIRLAERLRAFFGEADNIAQLANTRFGLMTRFYARSMAPRFAASQSKGIELNTQFFPGPSPEHKFHVDIPIDNFRRIPMLAFDGKPYTVHNIVIAAANVAGGVHARPKPDNRWLVPICEEIFLRDRKTGLSILKCIASYVVEAYAPLRRAFIAPYAAGQARYSRQPLFVSDGKFHALEFDGNAYLEDVLKLSPFNAFCFNIVITPGDPVPQRKIVADLGLRDENTPRFSLGLEADKLFFTFTSEDRTQAEIAANITAKRFVCIFACCDPSQDGISLSLSVNGAKIERQFSGVKLPIEFEGKQTIGTDIYGRHGAVFQMTTSMIWSDTLPTSEKAKLMQDLMESAAAPPHWIVTKNKGINITKIYNQAIKNN